MALGRTFREINRRIAPSPAGVRSLRNRNKNRMTGGLKMTEIIPFPVRPNAPSQCPDKNSPARRAIPYTLLEAAAKMLNEVVKERRGEVLTDDDWKRIQRACNFIDGAKSIAREHGLPHGETTN